MEFIFKKINAVGSQKNHLINIYSVGKKIYDVIDVCKNPCESPNYLQAIDNIIENMDGQETNPEESLKFFDISIKN